MTQTATKNPKMTTPAKNPSAKLQSAELLKLGRLCVLQGSKLNDKGGKHALNDLLCNGIESGTYGSIIITGYVEPKKWTFRTDPAHIYKHLDYPMNPGGAVICLDKYEDEEGTSPEYRLTYESLLIGLARLSLDHPRIYADWISDNADALTGDALVQCALWGDIVYG